MFYRLHKMLEGLDARLMSPVETGTRHMDAQEWLFPILVGLSVALAVLALGWQRRGG